MPNILFEPLTFCPGGILSILFSARFMSFVEVVMTGRSIGMRCEALSDEVSDEVLMTQSKPQKNPLKS